MLDVQQILNDTEYYTFVKDHRGRFIAASEGFAHIADADSPQDLLGKTDAMMSWRALAHFFRQCDQKIMQGYAMYSVAEKITHRQKNIAILTTKQPLLNRQGQCIGVIGFFNVAEFTPQQTPHAYFDAITEKLHLGQVFSGRYLTKRETAVYRQLLLGHSANQIGTKLGLSKRTVEDYIEKIKAKLNCASKSEIFSTAIEYHHLTQLFQSFFTPFAMSPH